MSNTSRKIANFIYVTFGIYMTANTVNKALEASANVLESQNEIIKNEIKQKSQYVGMDETTFKRGDGHNGYVWVAQTSFATVVLFTPTKSSLVLDLFFTWIKDKVGIIDGYLGYTRFFKIKQRCWRHILADAEKLAVRHNEHVAAYDIIITFYRYIKSIKTLNPFTRMNLNRQIYHLFKGIKIETLLNNALPHLFTFLSYPGMPPHNNYTEQQMRDIVSQRNARHKTVTKKGNRIHSNLLTVNYTCDKQNISIARAFLELIKNLSWNIFERDKDTPC